MTAWLVDTLIWTSALMLLVLIVREPVRRQFGAGVAYALWAIPATRIFMPSLTHTVERPAPASAITPSTEAVTPVVTQLSDLAIMAPSVVVQQPSLIEQIGGWPALLGAIWIAGAASLFGNRFAYYLKERRHILSGAESLGRLGAIRIVCSAAVEGPLAFGVLDRVIAVPKHFRNHFTRSERRLALAHELAHHRSGDLIANSIAFVLLSLQWFNPLAWASYAAFRFDQEAACDARVLDRADDPAAYGRAIAKAASGRALLFASALDRKSTLKRRLKGMIHTRAKGRRRLGNMLVLGSVAIVLPLTATKAIEYVETEPSASKMPLVSISTSANTKVEPLVESVPAVTPSEAVIPASRTIQTFGESKVYSKMTAQERADYEEAIDALREALEEIREERRELRADLKEAKADYRDRVDGEEIRQEIAEARLEIQEAMEEIDLNRKEIIDEGGDPERIKANLRAALANVDSMNVESMVNGTIVKVDFESVAASTEASLDAAEARIRKSLEEMEARRRR